MPITRILPVCCVCGQVSNGPAGASREGEWTLFQTYLDEHHIDRTGIRFSHTYCPSCYNTEARKWQLLPPSPLSA